MGNDSFQNQIAELVLAKKSIVLPVAPGEYRISGTLSIEVNAIIKKGESVEYRPTASLPLKAVLAIALRKAGIQRDNISKLIISAAKEAMDNGKHLGNAEYAASLEASLEMVEKTLDKLPPQKREGQTRISGGFNITESKLEVLIS